MKSMPVGKSRSIEHAPTGEAPACEIVHQEQRGSMPRRFQEEKRLVVALSRASTPESFASVSAFRRVITGVLQSAVHFDSPLLLYSH